MPEVIVPDNLKAAVLRAAFDATTEPILNRSHRELARYFGFEIDPTPAHSPENPARFGHNTTFDTESATCPMAPDEEEEGAELRNREQKMRPSV